MKSNQLKSLIKGVLTEIHRKRHGGSGEYELEDVEIDGQTIAKVITPEHMLKFDISIEYDADPGCEGRTYGPPEDCYPGEGASAELIDAYITRLEISPPKSQEYVEVNIDRLRQKFPQIYQAFHKIAMAYVDQNWSSIEEKIIEGFDFDYDPRDEPDYDDRDFDRQ
jgi:hypothetical protein